MRLKLRFITIVSLLTWIVILVADSISNVAYTHVAGAPAARCGSIANPATCTSCHSGGPNTVQPGWITSDVPLSGYVPGATYHITATAVYAGRTRFGFEISPQDPAGTYIGTMIDTSSEMQIISVKYMTHTSAGTIGSGSRTWTFKWTAPTTMTDSVTFYGAFLCSNNSSSSSGDSTYKSSLTVHRDPTSDIPNDLNNEQEVLVCPQPASDHVYVGYKNEYGGKVEMNLYDVQGRMIAPLLMEHQAPGLQNNLVIFPFILNTGVYFLKISTETGNVARRILIQQ